MLAAPVQQVQVDALQPQAVPAALAGIVHALPAGVVRVDLADDEDLVAHQRAGAHRLGERLADDLFRATLAVHLGGVDDAVAHLQRQAHGGHLGRALALDSPMRQVPRPSEGQVLPSGKRTCCMGLGF